MKVTKHSSIAFQIWTELGIFEGMNKGWVNPEFYFALKWKKQKSYLNVLSRLTKFYKSFSLESQYSTDHKNWIEKVFDFFGQRINRHGEITICHHAKSIFYFKFLTVWAFESSIFACF